MLTAAVASIVAKNGSYLRACLEQTGLVKSVAEWGIDARQHPAPGRSGARRGADRPHARTGALF